MALDPNIILQAKPVQFENPLNALAQYTSIKSAQNQNALADMRYNEAQRSLGKKNALAASYKGAFEPDGTFNRTKLISGMAQNDLGEEIPSIQKSYLEQDKMAADAGKTQAEVTGLVMSQRRDQLNTVNDPQAAAQWASSMYTDPRLKGILQGTAEEAIARIPTDPQGFSQWKQQALVNAEKLSAHYDAEANRGVTKRGQDITAATSRENNQATVANAARTADMSDARAREFNATKVEDNRIKREAKDDATSLAKGGQLASFDTMLGTLDRLAKHPGLSSSVGIEGILPTTPGSNSANFQAELNTFQSQAFIPMVAQLKGMGALSDAEGKKLTAAVGALDPRMGEKAFRDSLERITSDMTAARQRMTAKAPDLNNMTPQQRAQVLDTAAKQFNVPKNGAMNTPKIGDVEGGYRFKGGSPSDPRAWEKAQ